MRFNSWIADTWAEETEPGKRSSRIDAPSAFPELERQYELTPTQDEYGTVILACSEKSEKEEALTR